MKYVLWINGKEEGPYDKSQIVEMLSNGKITDRTRCLPEDRGGYWQPIRKVPGLLEGAAPRSMGRDHVLSIGAGIVVLVTFLGLLQMYRTHGDRAGTAAMGPAASGATVERGFKDEHIRHELTALIPSISRRAPWPGAVQEALASLDALASVEGARCSATQRNLLRGTMDNLRIVLADWEEYKMHAAHDSDPAEEKKADRALDDCMARLEKARGMLTEAAGAF
jgi:hypothetical protein